MRFAPQGVIYCTTFKIRTHNPGNCRASVRRFTAMTVILVQYFLIIFEKHPVFRFVVMLIFPMGFTAHAPFFANF